MDVNVKASRGRQSLNPFGNEILNVYKNIKGLFEHNPASYNIDDVKIKCFVLYLAISGVLGTIASVSTIGQIDISNPINFIVIILMPLSLVFLAPTAYYYKSEKICALLFFYCFIILCCNTYIDGRNGIDSTIFGLILVVAMTQYFSWQGMIFSMVGFLIQNLGIPELNMRLNPETSVLYDFNYYQYAGFDIITALVVGICVLVFRNGLLNASEELEKERHRSKIAERAKSEFLANMSHEIRTPMNGIVGMSALLEKTELNNKQKMFTDIIIKSGNSLLTIINDILDFSKLDAGKMKLDHAPFNLQEAVEDVAALFSSEIAQKDIDIILRVSPSIPDPVIGDVGRIRQVLMNLIGNAVKFTDNGHVYINIDCDGISELVVEDNGESYKNLKLNIQVTDTGIGIEQGKIDHIFSKFSQVDESATRKHEGTGLGLAISSQLIDLMGGTISVESREGDGSCFTIKMDIKAGEVQNVKEMPQVLKGSKVLVVETNPLIASIRKERFQSWGLDAGSVATGRECIDCLSQMTLQNLLPDLMVISCQLKDMDGLDVVAKIRANPKLAQIPVLMLATVDNLEDNQQYSKLKIEANLLKPWYTSVLMDTILKVLEVKRANVEYKPNDTEKIDALEFMAS